jgi:hypothetical protein
VGPETEVDVVGTLLEARVETVDGIEDGSTKSQVACHSPWAAPECGESFRQWSCPDAIADLMGIEGVVLEPPSRDVEVVQCGTQSGYPVVGHNVIGVAEENPISSGGADPSVSRSVRATTRLADNTKTGQPSPPSVEQYSGSVDRSIVDHDEFPGMIETLTCQSIELALEGVLGVSRRHDNADGERHGSGASFRGSQLQGDARTTSAQSPRFHQSATAAPRGLQRRLP